MQNSGSNNNKGSNSNRSNNNNRSCNRNKNNYYRRAVAIEAAAATTTAAAVGMLTATTVGAFLFPVPLLATAKYFPKLKEQLLQELPERLVYELKLRRKTRLT